MRYLCRTVRLGILIPSTSVFKGLDAFSDADWVRDESLRRSRTGVVIFYHACPLFWSSRLQQAKVTSKAVAAFAALAVFGKELSCLRDVLRYL